MCASYTSQASLNIFWFQILFQLFIVRLHFRLPDFYLAQLQTEISGDFLSAGLRHGSCCKKTTQQQNDRNSIYKPFHFPTPLVILLESQPDPRQPPYKNLATTPAC